MTKPLVVVLLEKILDLLWRIGEFVSAIFFVNFMVVSYILVSLYIPRERMTFIKYHFFLPTNILITYFLVAFFIALNLFPLYLYWILIPIDYGTQRFMFILKCLYSPIHVVLTFVFFIWGGSKWFEDWRVLNRGLYLRNFLNNEGILQNLYMFPFMLLGLIFSYVSMILNPIRYYYFVVRNYDRMAGHSSAMMGNIGKTILDYVTLPFLLLTILIPFRIPHLMRAGQQRRTHGFFMKQGIMSVVELPVFLISSSMVLLTIYKTPWFFKRLIFEVDVDDRLKFCWETVVDILIDLPHLIFLVILIVTIWRCSFVLRKKVTRKRIRKEFVLLVMDILCLPLGIPVFLTIFRVPQLLKQWKDEEDVYLKRIILYVIGVYSIFDLFVHLTFGVVSAVFFWRMIFLVPRWRKAKNDRKSYEVIRSFVLLLLDFPCTLFFFSCLLTVYRFRRMIRFWKKKKSFHLATSWEFLGIICDIPFIFLGIMTLWRLPLLLFNIAYRCRSITVAREEVLNQLNETIIDFGAFVSFVVLFLSVYHIFRLRWILKSKKKSGVRKGIMKCLVNELPYNLFQCVCSYFILFTFIRIPVTLRHLGDTRGGKARARKIVVIHFFSLFFDLMSVAATVVIFIILFWRIKKVIRIYRSNPYFVASKDDSFWETVETQIQIIKVLRSDIFGFTKRVVLFVLCTTASITIWRGKKIFYVVFYWVDSPLDSFSKKLRWVVLQNLLTLIEPICFLLMILILCTWRSLIMIGWIRLRRREGRLAVIHFDILKEFMQLVIDLPFLVMFLLLIVTHYRIPVMYNYYFVEDYGFSYRAFLFYEFKQLLYDAPLILISFVCVVITPFRITEWFKAVYLEKRDRRRRKKLHRIIAYTLVDFTTLTFSVLVLLFFWRIPFFIHQYFLKGDGFRKCVYFQAFWGFMDVIWMLEVLTIFLFLFNVVEWGQNMVHVFQQWFVVRKEWLKVYQRIRSDRMKRERVKKNDEYNGQILPNEIMFEVFSYEPVFDLVRSSHVCKHWRKVCTRDILWKSHVDDLFGRRLQNENDGGGVYAKAFQDAYGEKYAKQGLQEIKRRHFSRLRRARRKTRQEVAYDIGIRNLTHGRFFHTILTFPYSFPCFQLKLLGILLTPIHLFNEFTNSWGMYLYLRVFKQLRKDEIRRIRPLPESNYFNWKQMHKCTVLAIVTFLGLMIYYAVVTIDFALFVVMFVWFLGAPLWFRVFVRMPRVVKAPIDILLKLLMVLTIPVVIVLVLNAVITPFFFNVRRACLEPIQPFIAKNLGVDVVRPFFKDLYDNTVGGLDVHKLVVYYLKIHVYVLWMEAAVLQWIIKKFISPIFILESFWSKISFPIFWCWFNYYSLNLYRKLYIRRFFKWYDPIKASAELFRRSLEEPTSLCFKLGSCGEILAIPYVFVWVFWPVAVVIYFSKWLFLLPSMIVTVAFLVYSVDAVLVTYRRARRGI